MVILFHNVILGHGKEYLFNKGKLAGGCLLAVKSWFGTKCEVQGVQTLHLLILAGNDTRGHIFLLMLSNVQHCSGSQTFGLTHDEVVKLQSKAM